MTDILHYRYNPDLTTFGGRLRYAMEQRNVSSEMLAQELTRNGFSVTRKNIDQWCRIDADTWRGQTEATPKGWVITRKGQGLDNSRGPYPLEIQLMVLYLQINGTWLFIGGDLPMNRGGDLPTTRDDMQALWGADKKTRQLFNYIMRLNDKARESLIDYLIHTNQIDLMDDD